MIDRTQKLDKIHQDIETEVSELRKQSGALKREVEKDGREKNKIIKEIKDIRKQKSEALDESKKDCLTRTELKRDIRALRTVKNSTEKEIEKLVGDAEKREIAVTNSEDEIAKLKAETEENNQKAKNGLRATNRINTDLLNKISIVEKEELSIAKKTRSLDEKLNEIAIGKEKVFVEHEKAKGITEEIDKLRLDTVGIVAQAKEEKTKYDSLVRGIAFKDKEKDRLIVKSQAIILNLENRELKVKQDESANESATKHLKVTHNKVAIAEAKVSKILDHLMKEKKIQKQLKELGLVK